MSMWDVVTNVAIIVALVTGISFPLFYLRSPWHSTLPGRGLMLFSIIIGAIFILITVRSVANVMLPEWVRAVIYALIACATTNQLIVLLKVQSRDYEPEGEKENGYREEANH